MLKNGCICQCDNTNLLMFIKDPLVDQKFIAIRGTSVKPLPLTSAS